MIKDEMKALLSAYAAGTLTPSEKQRLFEASLTDQEIFDALAAEQPMRELLAQPHAREALLSALNPHTVIPALAAAPARTHTSNRWVYVALAASLVIGVATISYWPKAQPVPPPPPPAEVAVATPPPPPVLEPPAPAPARAVKARPTEQPSPQPKRERSEAETTPPQPAPPIVAETRQADVKESLAKSADSRRVTLESNSILPAAPAAGAMARTAATFRAPEVFINANQLHIAVPTASFYYAFLIDGETTTPLNTTPAVTPTTPHSITLPPHTAGAEVWVHITPASDPVLNRALTGVLPLPARPWTKLKVQ